MKKILEKIVVLNKPLTEQEIRALADQDENGYVSGVVQVELYKVITGDLESFLDLLGDKLVDSCLLENIEYEVVGCADGDLLIYVSGDPSSVLEN